MKRKLMTFSAVALTVAAVLIVPYAVVPAEKNYSTMIMRDCLRAVDRYVPRSNDFRILEVVSSVATKEAAESRKLPIGAQDLVKSGEYSPHLAGVFVTYRKNENEYPFHCHYVSIFDPKSNEHKHIHLTEVSNDYLIINKFTASLWPELRTNYFERLASLFPVPAMIVSHFE